ncbi:TAZ [Bugula neritina]|uniref:TAZ n=1 Tax=Bugula neritina TaxID=10212 RepID=A0A7J7KK73_BUGNE|nr:TAZ [Bugula neritina]
MSAISHSNSSEETILLDTDTAVSTNYTYLEDSCESSYDVTDTCGREFDATDTCHGRYDTTGTSGSGYDNTGTSGSGYDATDTCGSDYDGTDTCDGGYDVGNTSESELLDKLETCQDKNDSKSCNKTGLSGVKPIPRMSLCRILVINLPWFGLALMYLILTVEVVPAQVEAMVGNKIKGTVLGIMVAIGALLTLFVSPLLGLMSDRLETKIGKRRPVMLVSSVLLCFSLMGMSFSVSNVKFSGNSSVSECHPNLTVRRCAPYSKASELYIRGPHLKIDGGKGLSQTQTVNLPLFEYIAAGNISGSMGAYAVCYLGSVLTYTGIAVPYNALIADKTHPDQRGVNSGVMGGMVLLGNIAGACLGLFISVSLVSMLTLILCYIPP